MAKLELRNISKLYGTDEVVKNVTLTVEDKEFFVLVGPSGSGKSSLLRMIAGLDDISRGSLLIDGHEMNGVSPKDRNVAMVFQNYALYPHMTVYENMAFGLRLRGYSGGEIDARIQEAASILGIGTLLKRKPTEISGGQRQRVAVGRAIVRKPRVFLFDEPLSNLDAKLRAQMRAELAHLHKRFQTTVIYVTHDQIEAMTMGDRICVLREGAVQQVAQPLDIYEKPQNRFVAEFIGTPTINIFEVSVLIKGDRVWLDQGHFQLLLPSRFAAEGLRAGEKLLLGVRPEDVHDKLFEPGTGTENNSLLAMVDLVEPVGHEIYLHLEVGDSRLIARVEPGNPAQVNQHVEVAINMEKIHLFSGETHERIPENQGD